MTRNRGTPDNAGQAIERGVERLKDFLAAEMQATHRRVEDRAHIAITGTGRSQVAILAGPRSRSRR